MNIKKLAENVKIDLLNMLYDKNSNIEMNNYYNNENKKFIDPEECNNIADLVHYLIIKNNKL